MSNSNQEHTGFSTGERRVFAAAAAAVVAVAATPHVMSLGNNEASIARHAISENVYTQSGYGQDVTEGNRIDKIGTSVIVEAQQGDNAGKIAQRYAKKGSYAAVKHYVEEQTGKYVEVGEPTAIPMKAINQTRFKPVNGNHHDISIPQWGTKKGAVKHAPGQVVFLVDNPKKPKR